MPTDSFEYGPDRRTQRWCTTVSVEDPISFSADQSFQSIRATALIDFGNAKKLLRQETCRRSAVDQEGKARPPREFLRACPPRCTLP
jgi:hypothetical protein